MSDVNRTGRVDLSAVLGFVLATISLLASPVIQAQQLEEVVVTAQRRQQSLQEVPISVGVFSGAEITKQGFKDFEDMSKFSPSVTVQNGVQQQQVTIRGFGTTGNTLTLQQATPVFVDGIHYGRQSMIQNAFLDTQRVEVLKGPQPLYFGMNATAGAFNVVSRKPTPDWEGYLTSEIGNFGEKKFEGALGGPLTRTLGMRVAGIYERSDGPVRNRITRDHMPAFDNLGGRVILEWKPNDRLDVTGKFDISRQRNGAELQVGCLSGGSLSGFDKDSPIKGTSTPNNRGNERSVWAPPPKGIGFSGDAVLPRQATGTSCFHDGYGFSTGGPYLEPQPNVNEENGKKNDGAVDIRAAADAFAAQQGPGGPGDGGANTHGIKGSDDIDSYNALLDAAYRLDNGMSVHSETGMVRFLRTDVRDNSYSPFFMNYQGRGEDYYQYSEQVRIETPDAGYDIPVDFPGGLNVEAMAGGFWQQGNLDVFSSSLRANVRRGQRFNKVWEDSTWYAGFWELTFNMLDNQVSLDVGGRYTDVSKDVFVEGYGAQWIFDQKPCDSKGTDANPATCAVDPDFKKVDPTLTTFSLGAGYTDPSQGVRIDSPVILVDGADMNNLWTAALWKDTRDVPLNWRSGGADAVGLTAPEMQVREGPHRVHQHASNYDNQIVLRYRPNAMNGNLSMYAKWATAFKGPVTDTGQTSIPAAVTDMTFKPEYSEAWEVGAKGRLFNGRARYDVSLFTEKFTDLQTFAAAPPFNAAEQQDVSLNAGEEDVKGIEFSGQVAAMQGLTLSVGGALMDGQMKQFDGGGCTDTEEIAAAANAVNNPGNFDAAELAMANDILDAIGTSRKAHSLKVAIPSKLLINGGCRLEDKTLADGTVRKEGTIDRSGDVSPRTPDWKFVLGMDYTRPVWDRYMVSLNAKGYLSSGYLTDGSTFNRSVMYHTHGDVNVSGGFGSQDGTWQVVAFARNLLQATVGYDPRYDLVRDGLTTAHVTRSSFTSYGMRFEYHFR